MGEIIDWVFPSTRIGEAVKVRPATLGIFYGLGCDPWKEGGKSISELCERRGLGMQALLQELTRFPVPVRSSPWEELPVYYLLDYLTAEHRQLLYSDLPAFRCLLELPFPEASGGQLFRLLLRALDKFNETFRDHVKEEEERLFPAILMNEHILRHGGSIDPAGHGFDCLMVSSRLFGIEGDFSLYLDEWTDTCKRTEDDRNRPKAADMADQVMQRLESRIRSHGELERERLHPAASRIENGLALSPAF